MELAGYEKAEKSVLLISQARLQSQAITLTESLDISLCDFD